MYNAFVLKKITQILWAAFLFTFPFSLRFIIYEEASYRFGHFSPWVTGFFYAPEVLLIVAFLLWLFSSKILELKKIRNHKSEIKNILAILFLLNAGIVTFLRGDIILFLFFLLRIAEASAVFLLIKKELLPPKTAIKILLAAAGFQLVLGWLQWFFNHSLGLGRLGEPVVGPDIAGVAKNNLADGTKHIRPYGTFLHPNILAAYLMSILFIKLSYLRKYHLLFWLIILTAGIYFTGSLAAQLVTIVGFVLIIILASIRKKQRKNKLSLTLFTLLIVGNIALFAGSHFLSSDDTSFQERIAQNLISRDMILAHPFGVGVGNFTLEMENFSAEKLLPWNFQPVHNVYFLIMNETGIQGLLILFIILTFFCYRHTLTVRSLPLFLLLLIAPFDHFLFDSFAGVILIALVLGFGLGNTFNQ